MPEAIQASSPTAACLGEPGSPCRPVATPSKNTLGINSHLDPTPPKNPFTPRQHLRNSRTGQPGTNLPSPGLQAPSQPRAGPRLPVSVTTLADLPGHTHPYARHTHWLCRPGFHSFWFAKPPSGSPPGSPAMLSVHALSEPQLRDCFVLLGWEPAHSRHSRGVHPH